MDGQTDEWGEEGEEGGGERDREEGKRNKNKERQRQRDLLLGGKWGSPV